MTNYIQVEGASRYEVGDDGSVWSNCTGRRTKLNPRWVGGGAKNGKKNQYLTVALWCDDGKKRERKVHQLVLEHFVSPRPPGMMGLHGDGDRSNNTLANLRWGTHMDNTVDAALHGGASPKLTPAALADIRSSPLGPNALAKKYGVNRITIWKARKGRSWASV